MSDEPLSPADYDLARTAAFAQARDDPFLIELADMADHDLSTAVCMLVNSVFITGILTAPKAMADEVDRARAWLADQSRSHVGQGELAPDEFERRLRDFSTATSREYASRTAELAKTREEAEPYIRDDGFAFEQAPASITRRVIHAGLRHFITLREAQIIAPGQPGMTRLPVLRVALAHVAAWWVIQFDDQGRASFQLFQLGDDQ